LVPYFKATREKLDLAEDHPALAIFDVFKSHRCDSVLKKLQEHTFTKYLSLLVARGNFNPLMSVLMKNSSFK